MSRFVAFSVGSLLFLTHWAWAGEGYDVQVKDISPQTVVCVKAKTTMDKISQEMGRLYGQIFQYLGSQKIGPTGPALAVYYSWVGQELALEACVPVAEGASEKGQIKVRKLSGGPMARVIHLGPYEKIGGAYDAIKEWMNKNGYKSDGPCREVYLVAPPSNPSDYKTEILWPVKKK